MMKEQKKSIGKSVLITFVLLLAWFLIIKAGTAFASKNLFEITDAEVSTRSATVNISDFNFSSGKVSSNIVFHKVGDSVTYKLKIKNTGDAEYRIKSVKDVNKNSCISYKYSSVVGKKVAADEEFAFELIQTYSQENTDIANREQRLSVAIVFELEDEAGNTDETEIPINEDEGNIPAPVFPITGDEDTDTYHVVDENTVVKVNPKTNDNIALYIIIFATASVLLLVVLATRKKDVLGNANLDPARYAGTKKGLKRFKIVSFFLIIGAALFPAIGRAMQNNSIEFTGAVTFKDKLIITYTVNGEKFEKVVSFESKLELEDPEVPGYKFERWEDKDGNEFDAEVPITSDIELIAKFTPIEYTVSYNLNGGSLGEQTNPESYTIESEDITLINPTKAGYKFTGWTGTGLDDKTENVTIAQGSTENRTFEANWEMEEYTISYELNGGNLGEQTNPESYTIESEDITLNNPTRYGYTFAGWTGTGLDVVTENVTIAKGTTENRTYTANWTVNEYTITYELNGGNLGEQTNPETYTIESEDITLNNPTREGYTFAGWTGTGLDNPTENVTITKGSTENRTYTANWTVNVYTITYNLNDGIVENTGIYTVESEDITLNNPTRDGYTFAGWTGTGLDVATENVTITKGSTGNREYTANWSAIEYTISYELNGGNLGEQTNPGTYTIESEDITLNNPTRNGYTFAGWTGTGLSENTTTVTITKGTTENRTYTANWTATEYTISYELNGGSLGEQINPGTYTIEREDITLNNPTREGYTFAGWTGTDLSENTTTVTITKGTTENRTYTANWTATEYTISYELNGGSLGEQTNPGTYTIESEDITLNNPTRKGYTFAGWTGTDLSERTTAVTIEKGTTENRTYTANWTANTYEIVFDSNSGSGSMENESMTYDVAKTLTANAFTYEDHAFTGWNTQADGNGTAYENEASVNNLATEGTVTLYAQWRELAEVTVTFDATSDGTLADNTRVVKEGKTIGELPIPTSNREDYRFKGWYTDQTYTTKITADTVITGETTFYAQFKYYMSTVFLHTAEVKFNGEGVNLESTDTRFTNSDYINTGVSLFSEANFDKDFEINFEIVSFDLSENIQQATLLASKYENASLNYPGFVFRRYNTDQKKVEMTGRVGASGNGYTRQFDISTVQKVKITRKNGKIYYSVNDGELLLVCDTQELTDRDIRFDTTVVFGAALTENNGTMRHFKGTLKNMKIELEDDD